MKNCLSLWAEVLSLLLVFSCIDKVEAPTSYNEGNITEITAFLDNNSETKTGIIDNGDGKNIVWKSGNAISLFFNSGDSGGSIFTTTSTGSRATFTGTINAVSGDLSETGGTAYFWATYPYNASASCDGNSITTSLLHSQTAYANDVADDLLVTIGRSSTPAIYFRNTYTMIEFTLTQENITKITFSGNNDEYVAGEFKASFDGSNNIVSTPTANAVKTVEITPAETSSFATGTKYYFVFLPGSFSKGYTLKFTRSDGYEATYKRETAFNFAVGTYYNMYNKDSGLSFSAPDPLSNATAVDLGLSVKWGSFNVGASSPEEYGDYFSWGETEPKTYYDLSTYKWCNGSSSTLTKYNIFIRNGMVDNRTLLELSDDAARVNWGDKWRMPTDAEWTELRTQCDWTWTTQNGVNGYVVKSMTNTNSIFLPAAGSRSYDNLCDAGSWGTYWSSSLNTENTIFALGECLSSDDIWESARNRERGYTVRPVFGDHVAVLEVYLNKTNLSLSKGESGLLTAIFLPDNAAEKGVVWSSSRPSIASVDSKGVVTAHEAGTAVITGITVDGGKTAQCAVTVTAVPPAEPGAVDLGLSVKWASFNVGASSPEGFGKYFAWGETEPKTKYDWSTYKWCNGSYNTLTKYNINSNYGAVDGKTVLDISDDAARANWGGSWRIPAYSEWKELITNCEWTWTTQNGVNGYEVTSRTNGNSIFLPATGCWDVDDFYHVGTYGNYWSTALFSDDPRYACIMYFDFEARHPYPTTGSHRFEGITVRPVYGE